MNKPLRFFYAILRLFLRRSWGPFTELAEITSFDHAVSVSWSQGGEDIALIHALGGQSSGKYIDIGAHHPSRFSVTRHLYQMGWSGVNVDANQELINAFNEVRTRDVNVCAAVGLEASYTFTIFDEAAISTLDSEWRKKFISEKNKIAKEVEVEGRKLRSILDDFQPKNVLTFFRLMQKVPTCRFYKVLDLKLWRSLDFHCGFFLKRPHRYQMPFKPLL